MMATTQACVFDSFLEERARQMAVKDPTNIPTENPVALRRPLRVQVREVDAREPQDSATRKLADNQIAFCTRIDVMDEDLCNLGASMIQGFAGLSSKVDGLYAKVDAFMGLPPMRRHEDSSHAIVEAAARVGEAAKNKAKQIEADPNSNLTPDIVGDLVRTEVEEALGKQREADRVKKLEAEVKNVEDARAAAIETVRTKAKERRELWRLIISGIVVGFVLLVSGVYVSYMQGRLTGHAEAEAVKTSAAPILQAPNPTPVPQAPSATSSAATPLAPTHR
jgi:hypothetical protein